MMPKLAGLAILPSADASGELADRVKVLVDQHRVENRAADKTDKREL